MSSSVRFLTQIFLLFGCQRSASNSFQSRIALPSRFRSLFAYFPDLGCRHCRLVGLDGLEPSTSRLSGARSSHLSYRPLSYSRALIRITFCLTRLRSLSTRLPSCDVRGFLAHFPDFGRRHCRLVEMMGIEPMTPCLQGRCSPS